MKSAAPTEGGAPIANHAAVSGSPRRRFVVALIALPLLGATFSQGHFPTLRRLPQRTQEIVAIVALQARTARFMVDRMEDGADARFPPITRVPTESVVEELRPWLATYASTDIYEHFEEVAASEEAILIFFRLLVSTSASSIDGPPEAQANLKWIMDRVVLEARQSSVLWDLLLWGLVSDIADDPVDRLNLFAEAVLMAETQFEPQ